MILIHDLALGPETSDLEQKASALDPDQC
jgi:hypothetical protein